MRCSVEECRRPVKAKGYCDLHYKRWHRHGDPLVRKKMGNGDALEYYKTVVVAHRGNKCLIWPYDRDKNGYARIMIGGKNRSVARLVCEVVNGPAPTQKHDAAHGCGWGHGGCVAQAHLRWATRRENMADARAHGTIMGRRAKLDAPYMSTF